ncbi:MAG: outer membrane protein transport protein [Chromatiales bacterium]|jgi:long-chain fatty acid transport protein
MINKSNTGYIFLLSLMISGQAWATNGYFAHGIGIKGKGMGGVGIGLPQDSLAGGVNPANMGLLGNRMDVGVDIFRPIREANISGSNAGFTDGHFDANETTIFPVPEFGYNRVINDKMTLGVSVFGSGGMNVDYKTNIPLFGSTAVGTDLAQLFVVPNMSYKVQEKHYLGVGLNLVGQRLQIEGAQNFAAAPPSVFPGNVTNRDYAYSYGAGLRLGWLGQLSDRINVGATYQTRTWMTEFDGYKGLLAEQGDLDIPSNFGIGISFLATPDFTIAMDVVRIRFSEVAALKNPITNLPIGGLGADNGAGFGWEDQTVWKLGLAYQATPELTLRAGWNYGKTPIPSSETAFNIFAPATVEHHLTLGASWKLDQQREITISYMHAFEKEIKGSGSLVVPAAGAGGAGEVDLKMYQDSLGIAMSWKL